jgi:CheY-like chemotaxis protein
MRRHLGSYNSCSNDIASRDGPEEQNLARRRILLAEDHAEMADRLKSLLCFDYDVDVVSDGEALVDAAETKMPDVIVCDVMMPRMNGVAATRKVLTAHPDARISGATAGEGE